MVSKVIFVLVVVAVAVATGEDAAARYPAGVNPALCPGYPICDNSLLHTGTPSHWNYNHWDASAALRSHHLEINGPGGDKYPAGVSPAACPNYPYCGVLGAPVAPLHGYHVREYPAGVAPAACPNYPYCY